MIFFILFNDFRFGLGIFTTHVTYICLKCLFHMENHINGVTTVQCTMYLTPHSFSLKLHSATVVIVIFYEERTFKAYVCKMCRKYARIKSEIIKL